MDMRGSFCPNPCYTAAWIATGSHPYTFVEAMVQKIGQRKKEMVSVISDLPSKSRLTIRLEPLLRVLYSASLGAICCLNRHIQGMRPCLHLDWCSLR